MADLSVAFQEMAEDLASTDQARARLLTDLAHEMGRRWPPWRLISMVSRTESWQRTRTFEVDARTGQAPAEALWRCQARSGRAGARFDLQLRRSGSVDCERGVSGRRPSYLEKGVELHGRCENQVTVRVDTDRIAQVLSNLLDNALRHTPTGGQVTISCDVDAREVRVLVADTGEGIPADQLTAVFERFHRVDGSRRSESGGSGLV